MIRRNSLAASVQGGGPSFPVDCLHTGELIRQSSAQSSGADAFGRCCSICQKGRLYAIELGTCRHRAYADPLLEFTFNECCFSRLYGANSPVSTPFNGNPNPGARYSGATASINDAINSAGNNNIVSSGAESSAAITPSRLSSAMLSAVPKESISSNPPAPFATTTAANPSISKNVMELAVWELLQLFRRKVQLDNELLNVAVANVAVAKVQLLLQTKASGSGESNETSRLNEEELKQLQMAVQPIKKSIPSHMLMDPTASSAASFLFKSNANPSLTAWNRKPASFADFELFANGMNNAKDPLNLLTHSDYKWTLAGGLSDETSPNGEDMTEMLMEQN